MVTESKTKKAPIKKTQVRESAPAQSGNEAEAASERNRLQKRRVIVGTVVSNKMQKTIVVKVDRRVRHSLYKKYVTKSRRFKAHDETNNANIGDLVTLVESRPLSREKRWVLQSIVRRGGQVQEANV